MDSPILLKIHMKQVHRSTKKTFFVFLGNFKQIFCIVAIFGPKMAQKSQKISKSQKSKTMFYLHPPPSAPLIVGGGLNYQRGWIFSPKPQKRGGRAGQFLKNQE